MSTEGVAINNIARRLSNDILNSFGSDSSGLLESSVVRAKEKKDSHIFYFRDRYKIMTVRARQESRWEKTYESAFSWERHRVYEPGLVSLTRKPRKRRG